MLLGDQPFQRLTPHRDHSPVLANPSSQNERLRQARVGIGDLAIESRELRLDGVLTFNALLFGPISMDLQQGPFRRPHPIHVELNARAGICPIPEVWLSNRVACSQMPPVMGGLRGVLQMDAPSFEGMHT